MPLEGLRAWIGELERKLGARTRVGLVLVALAVGAGGAGIYLALNAADNSISKDDLQTLQEQVGQSAGTASSDPAIEALQSEAGETGAQVAKLQAEVKELQEEVKELQPAEKPK